MTRPGTRAAWLLGGALLAAGCTPDDGLVCTTEFAMVTVYVQDALAAPVTAATVTTVLVRTGDTLPVNQSLILLAPGHYVVVDDASTSRLRPTGDSLAVTIRNGPASLTAGYRVRGDGCHVGRLSGPDTLTMP